MGYKQSQNLTMDIPSHQLHKDDLNRHLAMDYAYVSVIVNVFLLTGILGNAAVLRIYYGKFHRKLGSRCFIPILAVMDMFSCVSGSILLLVQNNWAASFDFNGLCKTLYTLAYSCNITASLMLMIITIQRNLKICTHSHRKFHTVRKYSFPVLSLVGGIIAAAPVSFFTGNVAYIHKYYNQSGKRCNIIHAEDNNVYFNVYFGAVTMLFITIAGTLTVLNTLIARNIFRKMSTRPQTVIFIQYVPTEDATHSTRRKMSYLCTNKNESQMIMKTVASNSGKNKYSIIFMIISLIFILTWLPGLIITGLELSKPDLIESLPSSWFSFLRLMDSLFILSNIANPFIYGFCDRQFRKELYSIFSCNWPYRVSRGKDPDTITYTRGKIFSDAAS